ncbi:hypothetical protein X566_01525 [Afipia sp. P52-10]|uniref:hypothetical protein n=1 Tax=Afipia sp. P52-10 TaxID=1429916 RepID=UPI0003DF2CE4|nr:hypothetical protein [Afipia sp. P52-10]ETR79329.1 hypothetical protein X566_01525 [Afipia sp. P52-10]
MNNERPSRGGSYLRQPDGSLRRADAPAQHETPPVSQAQTPTPKPLRSRRTKE